MSKELKGNRDTVLQKLRGMLKREGIRIIECTEETKTGKGKSLVAPESVLHKQKSTSPSTLTPYLSPTLPATRRLTLPKSESH